MKKGKNTESAQLWAAHCDILCLGDGEEKDEAPVDDVEEGEGGEGGGVVVLQAVLALVMAKDSFKLLNQKRLSN